MRCEFCDSIVFRIRTRTGRSFIPDFCRDCKKLYDRELGEGWQNEPWHRETVKLHRRLMAIESNERGSIRLDDDNVPDISTDDVQTAEMTHEQAFRSALDEVITEILLEQPDLGWRRVHRVLCERGLPVAGGIVKTRMRARQS